MKDPANTYDEPDSGYLRLEQQIKWYDTKSGTAQRFYKRTKFVEIFCAVLIPFAARINADVTAFFGAVIILIESLQQVNQWSQNWITYRSTCEALRHENTHTWVDQGYMNRRQMKKR